MHGPSVGSYGVAVSPGGGRFLMSEVPLYKAGVVAVIKVLLHVGAHTSAALPFIIY